MNLNKVFLIGNLTRDPEMRSLPSGQPVANFAIATNRMWKDKAGAPQKQTEFHNIVMFGRLAEIAQQYLKKGASCMVEGRIQNRSWQAQDGTKKYRTEIIAEGMQMGPRPGSGAASYGGGGAGKDGQSSAGPSQADAPMQKEEELATVEYPADEINPDEIPF